MTTFRLPLLSEIPALRHVFTGRGPEPRPDPAGLVPLLGGRTGAAPALATLRQVHSNRCLLVEPAAEPARGAMIVMGEGDALATAAAGAALGVATADCLPLVAVDPSAPALAVIHAGWRGTLSGVLEAALDQMRTRLGARPERIVVGAGPAAGACCYRVGDEVVQAFASARPGHAGRILRDAADGARHLDLIEANRLQAMDAGVPEAGFAALGLCTICSPEATHSYRRDGAAAGRMWTLAMLVE